MYFTLSAVLALCLGISLQCSDPINETQVLLGLLCFASAYTSWASRLSAKYFRIIILTFAYQGFIASWLYKEPFKFAKLFGSLLCLAALFQLFVTTLGNLRIIPLTGLGTPLISIGISSSISASIGFGLILGLCYARK